MKSILTCVLTLSMWASAVCVMCGPVWSVCKLKSVRGVGSVWLPILTHPSHPRPSGLQWGGCWGWKGQWLQVPCVHFTEDLPWTLHRSRKLTSCSISWDWGGLAWTPAFLQTFYRWACCTAASRSGSGTVLPLCLDVTGAWLQYHQT